MIGTIICPSCDTATEISEADLAHFRSEETLKCASCSADLSARMRDIVERHEGPSVAAVTDDVSDEDAFEGLPVVGSFDTEGIGVEGDEETQPEVSQSLAAAAEPPSFPAPPPSGSQSTALAGGAAAPAGPASAGTAPMPAEAPVDEQTAESGGGVVPPDLSSADTVPEQPAATGGAIPEADLSANAPTPVVATPAMPPQDEATAPGEGTPTISEMGGSWDSDVTVPESPPEQQTTRRDSVPEAPSGEVTVPSQSVRPTAKPRQLAPMAGTRIGLLGIRVVRQRPVVQPVRAPNGHAIPQSTDEDTVVSGESAAASNDDTVANAPVPDSIAKPPPVDVGPAPEETTANAAASEAADTSNDVTVPEAPVPDPPADESPSAPEPKETPAASAAASLASPAPSESAAESETEPAASSTPSVVETQKVASSPQKIDPLATQRSPAPPPSAEGAKEPVRPKRTPPPRRSTTGPSSDSSISGRRPSSSGGPSLGLIVGIATPPVVVIIAVVVYILFIRPSGQIADATPTPTEAATATAAASPGSTETTVATPKPTRTRVASTSTPRPTPTPRATVRRTPRPTPNAAQQRRETALRVLGQAKTLRKGGRKSEALTRARKATQIDPRLGEAYCVIVLWQFFGGEEPVRRDIDACKRYAPRSDENRKNVEKYFP